MLVAKGTTSSIKFSAYVVFLFALLFAPDWLKMERLPAPFHIILGDSTLLTRAGRIGCVESIMGRGKQHVAFFHKLAVNAVAGCGDRHFDGDDQNFCKRHQAAAKGSSSFRCLQVLVIDCVTSSKLQI